MGTKKKEKVEKTSEEMAAEFNPTPIEEADDVSSDESEYKRSLEEEQGTLILRFFSKDERTGKILTRIRRKVYFPIDTNMEPGWYIATIVEKHENYGVMDTMALSDIPPNMWKPQHIKGIFIERDHKNNELHIYPAIPKENLEEQKSTCVHKIKLPEPKHKKGATIGEILKSKQLQ